MNAILKLLLGPNVAFLIALVKATYETLLAIRGRKTMPFDRLVGLVYSKLPKDWQDWASPQEIEECLESLVAFIIAAGKLFKPEPIGPMPDVLK